MKTYIINYDLRTPGRDYSRLYERIKGYPDWAHPMESCWAIRTSSTAVAVRDHLKAVMDSNDRLYVVEEGATSAWSNLPAGVGDWLQKKRAA